MKKFYQTCCKFEEYFTATLFVGMVALVFTSAILRFFKIQPSWNLDATSLLLAWACFLGADCAFRHGQLLGIDIVTRNFSKKTQTRIEILVLSIILFALVFFFYFGLKLVWTDRVRTYSSLPISYSWATLSLPVASFSMIITTVLRIHDRVNSKEAAK